MTTFPHSMRGFRMWTFLKPLHGRFTTRLLLSCCLLLMLTLLAGRGPDGHVGRELLGIPALPAVVPQEQPPLQESWVRGESREGFLAVDNVLQDSRTTREPLTAENYAQVEAEEKPGFHIKRVGNQTKTIRRRPHVKSDFLLATSDVNSSDFLSVMEYNRNFTARLTKDIYTAGFGIENAQLCSTKLVLVAVLVISAPDHVAERNAIRRSWGRAGSRTDIALAFLVGQPANTNALAAIVEESRQYGDIVLNHIKDVYENLSLKTLSAFEWVLRFCPKAAFLLKVDDDMFVQMDRLVRMASATLARNPAPRVVYGHISQRWKPVRNPESKYYITAKQYPGDLYPDFATGPSYLVSRSAVSDLYHAAQEQLYIHLEDVFLTGVVAELLNIPRQHVIEFKNNANRIPARFMGCTLLHTITIHKVLPGEQEEFDQLARNPACEKSANKDVKKTPSKP